MPRDLHGKVKLGRLRDSAILGAASCESRAVNCGMVLISDVWAESAPRFWQRRSKAGTPRSMGRRGREARHCALHGPPPPSTRGQALRGGDRPWAGQRAFAAPRCVWGAFSSQDRYRVATWRNSATFWSTMSGPSFMLTPKAEPRPASGTPMLMFMERASRSSVWGNMPFQ